MDPLAQPPVPPPSLPPEPPSFTVATLKLWDADVEWQRRLEATAVLAHEADLDVLLLQEVVVPARGPSCAEWLAGRLGFAGFTEYGFADRGDGSSVGNAVLCRTPLAGTEVVLFDGSDATGRRRGATMAWWDTPAGHRVLLGSVQLAVGGELESRRYDQAVMLDQAVTTRLAAAGGPVDAVVVGGSLGCRPEADTVRWLLGLEVDPRDEPTEWSDAWRATGGDAGGATVTMDNPWAAHVAASSGALPRWGAPPTRRDYLLTRGWAWGRVGGAMEATVAFDRPVEVDGYAVYPSDHFGVAARLIG